ncbi:MAG: family 43 glycosylhydrolase [Eubacterium sp.]|nr:family 43 glycosylhydrolase [Eubacterium sp.]
MKKLNKIMSVVLALALVFTMLPNYVKADAATKKFNYGPVHDPSIVTAYYEDETYTSETKLYPEQNADKTRKKMYFIFGSHMTFTYSFDLKNWTTFKNNICSDYASIFAEETKWGGTGSKSASYWNISGSLWAPDVIWNPDYVNDDNTKGAWMMYMTIAGVNRNSVITLLTATDLNGNWTRRGAVVYSGFDNGTYDYKMTDYQAVTGDTELNERYYGDTLTVENAKAEDNYSDRTYCAHAIDPNIKYDNGEYWMAYGSWDGGIYLLKIDSETGLRDTSRTYEYKANASDPYMGIKIAGGSFLNCGGEAPYIQKIGDKYYLFITYEGLEADGGYNMRYYTSDSLTGPYKDQSGDDARLASAALSSAYTKSTGKGSFSLQSTYWKGGVGSKVMSYYQWDHMDYGFLAQGHNSVLTDDDGKMYIAYHSRFTNSWGFTDRIHQIFVAKNGALVAAPFQYDDETLETKAYDAEKVAGSYQILSHVKVDATTKECVTEKTMTLNLDGTVTGEYTGTWSQATDGPYVTLKITGTDTSQTQTSSEYTYQGVFLAQNKEETDENVMTLTVMGNNDVSIWGYKTKDADPIQATAAPTATATATATTDSSESAAVAVGETYTVGKAKYEVTSSSKVVLKKAKNKKVTSVTIPSTVKVNGKSLKVTAIANKAFANCKKLKKVVIGANVTKIGSKAFYNCKKLKKIIVKSKKITKVGSNAFKGIHKKAVIKVPSAKLKAYKKKFAKKGQKSTVKIKK